MDFQENWEPFLPPNNRLIFPGCDLKHQLVFTAPQAAAQELHLEGAPKPGCRAGLQLRAAPPGQLSSAFSQGRSLLPSAHQGAGKERSSSVQTARDQCRGSSTAMARGRLEEDEEIKEREDRETCGRHVITGKTQLLCPHLSVWAQCTRAHLGQGLGGWKGRFTNRNLSLACDTCPTFYALWVKHLQECLLLLVKSTTGRARKDVVVAKCRTQHCPGERNDKN